MSCCCGNVGQTPLPVASEAGGGGTAPQFAEGVVADVDTFTPPFVYVLMRPAAFVGPQTPTRGAADAATRGRVL